jgi:hypothetical protein
MLTHEQETDYKLPDGESCWITVGELSIYISNGAGVSGQIIEVYPLGKEAEDPLQAIQLESLLQ